jgi:hypothetical protein
MHAAVDPLAEGEVARDEEQAPRVALGHLREENVGFVGGLLPVTSASASSRVCPTNDGTGILTPR